MKLPLCLCLYVIVSIVCHALNIPQVCKEVIDSDQVVCDHINNPIASNSEKLFEDINVYFSKVENLVKSLEQDKNGTINECKEVVMEGEPRYMIIQFDYWKLMNGFKWNITQVMKYMDWRDKTLYLWQKVDEASGRNSEYPKMK